MIGPDSTAAKSVAIAFRMNPAMWFLVAVAACSVLEALALLLLFRFSDRLRDHVSRLFNRLIKPLCDETGDLSFAHIIDVLIIAAYWGGAMIPEGVAVLVIASSHGTPVLMAAIDKMSLGVTSATNLARTVTEARTETKIDERHETIERKYTDDGVPKYSAPPVPGAMTAAGEPE
jgi:hypothetical protein